MKREIIKKNYYLEILDVIPLRSIELVVAVEMRRRGFSFLEIGQHFGVSKQAAAQMIRKYEKRLVAMGGTPLKDRKHKSPRKDRQCDQS